MIRTREFCEFEAFYHRNGVAGDGFYACSFKWRASRRDKWRMFKAVVFPREDDNGYLPPKQYAVLSDDINERWRGDDFIDALWKAIQLEGDKVYGNRAMNAALAKSA